METDENGLYYMRARYYNTDIKRFFNRDIIDRTIQNSQSLNKYSYVQGNPISLTDPFGLCPDFSGIMEYLKMVGHTLLDIAGFIPVVGFAADLANAYWYRCEGKPEMAMACAISAIPGAGDFIGAGLKGIGWAAKCQKLVKAADVVIDTSRFVGAVAQTELNVENFKLACASVAEEYKTTGSVSFWNGANLALSAVGVGVGAASIAGSARKLSSYGSMGSQKATTVCEWGCFVAGTPVKTEDGQKNIEDIKAGDLVYAKNTETGEEGYKEVVRVFIKNVNKLVHLQIDETKIDTTTNHPFWVVGYGFKEAGELQAGEKVLTATGEIKTITSIVVEELETPVTVYNFEVQDWHTYYVSELEVLVHNMCEVAGKSNSSGAAGAISESGRYSEDIIQYEKLKSQYAADEIYNAERIGSALKDDPSHRAASYLSKEQLANGRTYSFTGGDNKSYTLLQTKGQLDGVDGVFEYITNDAGQVTHQRFIKGGIYTGFPNQVVPKGGY